MSLTLPLSSPRGVTRTIRENLLPPEHRSPATRPRPHRRPGPRGHWYSRDSSPAQRKASVHMGPEPGPKRAPRGVDTAEPQCSSRHTTRAVAWSRSASQTEPQVRPRLTSRRPAQGCSPSVHQPGLGVSWGKRRLRGRPLGKWPPAPPHREEAGCRRTRTTWPGPKGPEGSTRVPGACGPGGFPPPSPPSCPLALGISLRF